MDTYRISRSDRMRAHLRTYFQKLGIKLFKRPELRFGISGLVSFGVHLFAVLLFLILSIFGSSDVLEIREIEFIDMSGDLAVAENPFDMPDAVAATTNPAASTEARGETVSLAKAPAATTKPAPKPSRSLDMQRRQAPVNLAHMAPLVLESREPEDVLKISPARGTRRDDKVTKLSRGIDLNSKSHIKLAKAEKRRPPAVHHATGSNGHSGGIVLAEQTTDGDYTVLAGPVVASTHPVQTGGSPLAESAASTLAEAPSKSKTFITGPLASREILYKIIPPFPRSARRQGIGASISLRFTVMETGIVKETVIVVRTSGSKQWDDTVIAALKKWRFKPLPVSGRKDQSGVITFQFVLE